jgi:hypothetical protein
MNTEPTKATFDAILHRPAQPGDDTSWTFVLLPKDASDMLPRRGRTTVDGTLDGVPFRATLEPDGQLGHWLRVSRELREAAAAQIGATVSVTITPVAEEPDPDVPPDFRAALDANGEAQATWDATTTLARLDWIHWITSAKQAATRAKRVAEACDKLAAGNRRVCCFDPSGFYSKAFKPPQPIA